MKSRGDGGFTLVELALSAAILAIIVTTISGAMIVFLSNGAYTTERDDHSGGAAILASYLDRDLASADRYELSASSAPCSAGAKDLVLFWDEWTASPGDVTPTPGQAFSAAYDLVDDGTGSRQLERWYCSGASQVSRSVLVPDLSAADFTEGSASAVCSSGSSLVLTLATYADDTGGAYHYAGCLKARLE
mgnify:CR=1 FL=1